MTATQSPLTALVSRDDLARQLNKSTRTLDRWHVERSGPRRTKIGKSIYSHARDVSEWIESQREESLG